MTTYTDKTVAINHEYQSEISRHICEIFKCNFNYVKAIRWVEVSILLHTYITIYYCLLLISLLNLDKKIKGNILVSYWRIKRFYVKKQLCNRKLNITSNLNTYCFKWLNTNLFRILYRKSIRQHIYSKKHKIYFNKRSKLRTEPPGSLRISKLVLHG